MKAAGDQKPGFKKLLKCKCRCICKSSVKELHPIFEWREQGTPGLGHHVLHISQSSHPSPEVIPAAFSCPNEYRQQALCW